MFVMEHYKISWEDALHLVQNRRYCISPNGGFLTQIKVIQTSSFGSAIVMCDEARNTRRFIKRIWLWLHTQRFGVLWRGGSETTKTTMRIRIGMSSCSVPLRYLLIIPPVMTIENVHLCRTNPMIPIRMQWKRDDAFALADTHFSPISYYHHFYHCYYFVIFIQLVHTNLLKS